MEKGILDMQLLMTTGKTMSRGVDKDDQTSANLQIAIYGVDAMGNKSASDPAGIHRVIPDGTITNNIGKTSSGFNIGRDAMKIWGRSAMPTPLINNLK